MSSYLELFLSGTILVLIQAVAALPWLYVLDPEGFKATIRRPEVIVGAVIALLVAAPASAGS